MMKSHTFCPGCRIDSSHLSGIKLGSVLWDYCSSTSCLEKSVVFTVLMADSAISRRRHAINQASSWFWDRVLVSASVADFGEYMRVIVAWTWCLLANKWESILRRVTFGLLASGGRVHVIYGWLRWATKSPSDRTISGAGIRTAALLSALFGLIIDCMIQSFHLLLPFLY